MAHNTLETLSILESSQYRILSPAVGLYSPMTSNGSILIGGAFIGYFKILNSIYHLHIPDNCYGSVILNSNLDKVFRVEFGQELLRLNPQKELEQIEKQHIAQVSDEHSIQQDEGFVITAFTDGIYYRRPSPDSPPYIDIGDKIEKGKTLGLIEVMKSFNHIIFKGTDSSDTGVILKIYVDDSAEVKSGQPLILIGD